MSTKSIAEIINEACELSTKKEKVNFLKTWDSMELRLILTLTYDTDRYELHFPRTRPPFTPSKFPDSHGLLYREARKLKYFVKGFEGDNIDKIKRESLFIQMLEAVDKDDAEVLCNMVERKPYKSLTKAVINEAFPGTISKKAKKES